MVTTNFLGMGSGLPFEELLAKEREASSVKLNPYLQKQKTLASWKMRALTASASAITKPLRPRRVKGQSPTATPWPWSSWRKRISLG